MKTEILKEEKERRAGQRIGFLQARRPPRAYATPDPAILNAWSAIRKYSDPRGFFYRL